MSLYLFLLAPGQTICTNDCTATGWFRNPQGNIVFAPVVNNGWCDDGTWSAVSTGFGVHAKCEYGTDCADCGVRGPMPPPSPAPPPYSPMDGMCGMDQPNVDRRRLMAGMAMPMGCGDIDCDVTRCNMHANERMVRTRFERSEGEQAETSTYHRVPVVALQHDGMAVEYTCSSVEADFLRGMIPHHQGAPIKYFQRQTRACAASIDSPAGKPRVCAQAQSTCAISC